MAELKEREDINPMRIDYDEVKNTLYERLNPYDPVSNSYPLEDTALDLSARLYDQSDSMLEKAKREIDDVLMNGRSTDQDIERITLAMDYLTRAMARRRMADMIDPFSDPQIKKEPLVSRQETPNQ